MCIRDRNATLATFFASKPSILNEFLIPKDKTVRVPAMTERPPKNFVFNWLILSTFPSDKAFSKSIPVFVNHPPASIKKKFCNLPSTPCALTPTLWRGWVNDDCILFSNWLSFPSLNPCSAKILSLFWFAAALCLSNWSLSAKFSFTPCKLKSSDVTCLDIFCNCCETLVNCSDCCCNKFVVTGSAWDCLDAPKN